MVELAKEIDFSKEIAENPALEQYILKAAKEISNTAEFQSIKKPELDLQLKNHVIVNNIPAAPAKILPTLTKVIENTLKKLQIFSEAGLIGMTIGTNEDGSSNQKLYLKYRTTQEAQLAFSKLDGFNLDAKHRFQCFFIKTIQEIYNSSQKYVEPKIKNKFELQNYNIDAKFRDQFIYREGGNLFCNYFDFMEKVPKNALQTPSIVMDKPSQLLFSPSGSYLIGIFPDGFRTYGGSKFQEINFFPHLGVKKIVFSPNEKYILSFNGTVYAQSKQNFIVWQVAQAKKLRSIKAEQSQQEESFKFSYDSKYIAGVFKQTQIIRVFELPQMTMIVDSQKKPIRIPIKYIQKIQWHTTKNLLIGLSFLPIKQKSASISATKISVIEIPSMKQLKWKSYGHDSGHGDILVSKNGEWVAIVLGKIAKKKIVSTVVQIGNFKKKDLEIDTIQVQQKLISYSFDTLNNRFAIVSKDQSVKETVSVRYNTYFYSIEDENKVQCIKQIGKIDKKSTTKVLFASNGLFFVLTNIDKESAYRGSYSFGYFNKQRNSVQLIKSDLSHAYMTYCDFDPSGRFIILGSHQSKSIQVWNVLGQILYRDSVSRQLQDILWRPRTKTLLDQKGEKALNEDWKNIKKKYQEADDKIINSLKYEKQEQRKKLKSEFQAYVKGKRQFYKQFLAERQKLLGFNQEISRIAQYEVRQKIDYIIIAGDKK